MKAVKKVLSNAIRILTIPMPSYESVTLSVWVNTGSRDESEKVSGISHFLEHMTFKGSKKRPSAKAISEVVDSIGGEFNAGTSKEWTDFYIKARWGVLETAFDILADMIINPILPASEIEKEKGVIIEEIRMYEDTPVLRIGEIFEQLIFTGSPLARDIIGTELTVKSVKRNDFLRYRKDHYVGESTIITVSGGVGSKKVEELAEKYFGKLPASPAGGQNSQPSLKLRPTGARVKLHSKKKEQAHLVLGFLGNKYGSRQRYQEALLATILGSGMSSRMFLEVREKRGLAYAIRTSVDHYQDTGYLATYAGVDPKKIDEAVKVMLNQYYGISSKELRITSQELKKAKEFIKGHLALSLEDTKDVNSFFGIEELMLGSVKTPQEVMAEIDNVTQEEIYEVAQKFFKPERLNLAIIGPYDDQARFERILK